MPAAVGTWGTHLTVPNSASVLLFPSGTQPMLRPCPALSPPWAHQLLSHARQTPTQGAWPRPGASMQLPEALDQADALADPWPT